MKISMKAFWLSLLSVCLLAPLQSNLSAAENKEAQALINSMRLKKYTKELVLTAEQQKKFKVLLDDEAVQTAKLDESGDLTPTTRSIKIRELHNETYGKMKPLLDSQQLEKFEKALAKTGKSKKG